MSASNLDELLEQAREERSYFDDPADLEGSAEESRARIESDPTTGRVLDVGPPGDEFRDGE